MLQKLHGIVAKLLPYDTVRFQLISCCQRNFIRISCHLFALCFNAYQFMAMHTLRMLPIGANVVVNVFSNEQTEEKYFILGTDLFHSYFNGNIVFFEVSTKEKGARSASFVLGGA